MDPVPYPRGYPHQIPPRTTVFLAWGGTTEGYWMLQALRRPSVHPASPFQVAWPMPRGQMMRSSLTRSPQARVTPALDSAAVANLPPSTVLLVKHLPVDMEGDTDLLMV